MTGSLKQRPQGSSKVAVEKGADVNALQIASEGDMQL